MADATTKPIREIEVGDWVLAEDPEPVSAVLAKWRICGSIRTRSPI